MPSRDAEARAGGGVAIEARGLGRRFGDHVALADLDLDVEPGEAFGLLGANGAGKTTFIRLVTGFLLPSSGSLHVDGLSPTRDAQAVRARLGFVAETSRLYPDLRVRAFLRFAAGARGLSGSARRRAVEEAVGRFRLEEVVRRPVGHLSKGYQQRVSLAQAFLTDPPLVIVDEPTSGLDPVQQEEVRSVLHGLRGRRTLLLCTHDLAEARALADRVAVLHRGRLVTVGPTEEVLGRGDPLALFRGEAAPAPEASP
ncbi:MAG: ABC transporter ATP-binding protein [Myxococcota bacterium]|nr:ABC transporter ATP-binding protein [Myxococcota bacterium]